MYIVYRRMGFKSIVKRLCFQDFEDIVYLIIAFVTCDWLGHIRLYFLQFKDFDLGKTRNQILEFKTRSTVHVQCRYNYGS